MTSTASKSTGRTARRVIAFALIALAAVTVAVLAAVAPGPRLGSCPQGEVKVASFAGAAECSPGQ